MERELFSYEQALEYAKNNTVIMSRIIDYDGHEICKKWFRIDDEGNVQARVFWYNFYPGGLTFDDIFSDKFENCALYSDDFKSNDWTIEENYLKDI